jgi:hypothetical protein
VSKRHITGWFTNSLTFTTTHKVKTQQVVKSRGQYCGDIELDVYLVNVTDPVSLVLDLHINHDSFGKVSDVALTRILMDTYITLMI